MRSHVEDSPCFSGWHYLTKVPAPSSSPSQAQQGHTVETPPPPGAPRRPCSRRATGSAREPAPCPARPSRELCPRLLSQPQGRSLQSRSRAGARPAPFPPPLGRAPLEPAASLSSPRCRSCGTSGQRLPSRPAAAPGGACRARLRVKGRDLRGSRLERGHCKS